MGFYVLGYTKKECFKIIKNIDDVYFLKIDYYTNVIQCEKNKRINWDFSNTINSESPEFSYYNVGLIFIQNDKIKHDQNTKETEKIKVYEHLKRYKHSENGFMVNIVRELEKYDEIIYENLHKINDVYHTMTRYVAVNGKKF